MTDNMTSLEAVISAIGLLEYMRDHTWAGAPLSTQLQIQATLVRLRYIQRTLEIVELMDGRRQPWQMKRIETNAPLPGFESILGVQL